MMDSFELTKIAAAVLTALLVIVGSRAAIQIAGPFAKKRSHAM